MSKKVRKAGLRRGQGVLRRLCVVAIGATCATAVAIGAPARGMADGPTPWPDGRWQPGPAQYGTAAAVSTKVTMSLDGIQLDAQIVYPTDLATGQRASGTFPVVMLISAYTTTAPTSFTPYGYIDAVVRVRGTGMSGGTGGPFSIPPDQDFRDIINWAAHQLDGSNGRVGLIGCSNEGGQELGAAAAVGPGSGLITMIPECIGMSDYYGEIYFSAGIPTNASMLYYGWAGLVMNATASIWAYPFETDLHSGGASAYNNDNWRQPVPTSLAGGRDQAVADRIVQSGASMLLWTSWCDTPVVGATDLYAGLQNVNDGRAWSLPMQPGQPTTSKYQIIVGGYGTTASPGACHATGTSDVGVELEWFDTWLKGVDTGLETTSTPMHLYEKGSGRWINASEYPATNTYTSYYLSAPGALKSDPSQLSSGTGSLVWAPSENGQNLLTFNSAPFTNGATLGGPIALTVDGSSTGTNLELVGTLYDVAPDGTTAEISRGTIQGSRRATDSDRTWVDTNGKLMRPWQSSRVDEFLNAGQTYTFNMWMFPRAWSVEPGHSLSLTFTGQSTDCANVLADNPCVYTPPEAQSLPGQYTVKYGPGSNSMVNLPLLPYHYFATALSGATPDSSGTVQPLDWGSAGPGTNVPETPATGLLLIASVPMLALVSVLARARRRTSTGRRS
jgi:predicted acyl esterase